MNQQPRFQLQLTFKAKKDLDVIAIVNYPTIILPNDRIRVKNHDAVLVADKYGRIRPAICRIIFDNVKPASFVSMMDAIEKIEKLRLLIFKYYIFCQDFNSKPFFLSQQMTHQCPKCEKEFSRKYTRDRHYKCQHTTQTFVPPRKDFTCPFCQLKGISTYFASKKDLVHHVDTEHIDSLVYRPRKSALKRKIIVFAKQLVSLQPLDQFVSDKKNEKEILDVILHELSKSETLKVSLIVTADYRIPSMQEHNNDDDSQLAVARDSFVLRTKSESFNRNETLFRAKHKVKGLLRSLIRREEDLLTRGSGWQFEALHSCEIEIVNVNTL